MKRGWAAILSFGIIVSASAAAGADEWKRNAGTCPQTFSGYKAATQEDLKKCLQLWMTYRSVAAMSSEEKSAVGTAANHLFSTGDAEGRYLAQMALSRLGFPLPAAKPGEQDGSGKKPTKAPAKVERPKYAPEIASDARQKKAKELNGKGLKAYKKGKHAEALKLYEQGIAADPRCASCIYNAACIYAIQKKEAQSIEYLRRLVDLGNRDALKFVHAARVDDDWASMRNNQEFKDVSGYVRVKVVNSLGEYGEEETTRIAKTLQQLKYHVASVGPDKADNRVRPIVWYKNNRAARNAAYIFQQVIKHPKVKFNMIDWETDSDVIISWGDVIKENKRGDPIVKNYGTKDPKAAEKELDDIMFEQDKALVEKENTARKVDHAIDTPDRMRQRGENAVNRVERTRDQIEHTIEKIQKPFK